MEIAEAAMSDELVEAMALAMRLAEPWSSFWSHADAKGLARAALSVARLAIRNEVLEEAARGAGRHHVNHPRTDEWGQGYMTGRQHAAAAIRALKDEQP